MTAEDPLLDLLRAGGRHWASIPEIPGVRELIEIGGGGQGRVYRGRRDSDDRAVAVKVLHPGAAMDGEASETTRRRFEREVELASRLDHPGLVRVLDHGITDRRPWLVMDLAEGRPGNVVAADASIGRERRIEIVIRLCDAVAHAHRRGVLHRDLKPSNVLVDDRDTVTVLDFGLARPASAPADATRVSVTGEFVGSVAWAAPEQFGADPDACDVRTDVHAIGAIAFLLLTGGPPVDPDAGLAEVVASIRTDRAPDPRTAAPDLPSDLAAIISRCLERDPDERYAGAEEVGADLRRVCAGEPIAASQSRAWRRAQRALRRSRRQLVASVVAVAVFGLVASGAVVLAKRAMDAEARADEAAMTTAAQERSARATLDAFIAALDESDASNGQPGAPVGVDAILERAEQMARRGGLDRRARGELRLVLARVRQNRGEYEVAEQNADRAMRLIPRTDVALWGSALELRGMARHGLDRHEDAYEDLMAAADARDAAIRDMEPGWNRTKLRRDAEFSRIHAATNLGVLGRYDAMRGILEGVSERTDVVGAGDPSIAARAHRRLAELEQTTGDHPKARRHIERSLQLLGSTGEASGFEAADLHRLVALMAIEEERWEEAAEAARTSYDMHVAMLDVPHPIAAFPALYEAEACARLGRRADAEAAIARAVAIRERMQPGSRMDVEAVRLLAKATRAMDALN